MFLPKQPNRKPMRRRAISPRFFQGAVLKEGPVRHEDLDPGQQHRELLLTNPSSELRASGADFFGGAFEPSRWLGVGRASFLLLSVFVVYFFVFVVCCVVVCVFFFLGGGVFFWCVLCYSPPDRKGLLDLK